MKHAHDLDRRPMVEKEYQIISMPRGAKTRRDIVTSRKQTGPLRNLTHSGLDFSDEGCRAATIVARDPIANLNEVAARCRPQ